jgi:hypothetical protein
MSSPIHQHRTTPRSASGCKARPLFVDGRAHRPICMHVKKASAVKQLRGQTTRKAETFVAVDMARPATSDASRVKL